jgi:hypothetical protein
VAAGYSNTPLWKKLGVRPGDRLVLLDGPPGWAVPELPDGVVANAEHAADSDALVEVIIAFCTSLAGLGATVASQAPRIFPAGAIWVAWPRRAAGHESDVSENDIRAVALPLGLVDVKVAALDHDWSGLRLVWRRENR